MTERRRTNAIMGRAHPGERMDTVRGEWRMMLPFVFVLAAIALLLLVPMYVTRTVNETRLRMTAFNSAQRLLLQVQSGFAHASAIVRTYMVAPDSTLRTEFAQFMRVEQQNFAALDSLADLLDDDSFRLAVAELRSRAVHRRSAQHAVFADSMSGAEYLRIHGGAIRGNALRRETATMTAALERDRRAARADIARTERRGMVAMTALALLAAASAIIVLRVAQRFRQRAVQERALREAALMLTEVYRLDDLLSRIAAAAAEVDGADASYVERTGDRAADVEIAAAAGSIIARRGAALAYERSMTRVAEDRGGVALIGNVARDAPEILEVAPGCEHCGAMVVLLRTDGDVHGALVLLHERPSRLWAPPHLRQSRIFAALASLAVRNAMMLRTAELREGKLRSVMDSRDRLIRGFSHDVKNPLGAADGHAALLEAGTVTEPAQRHEGLQRIRRGIRTALGLIDDMLELARAESGQLEIHSSPVDVRHVISNLVKDFHATADQAGHRLEAALPPDLPSLVTDRHRVRQILGNLVTNAVKYVPAGGNISISAAVRRGRRGRDPGQWITISVSDDGPGIPSEQQQLLFREFSRLSVPGPSGTGLGLAISANIARRLGGELVVDSVQGRGSIFTLWLPLATSQPVNGATS